MFGRTNFEDSVQKDAFHNGTISLHYDKQKWYKPRPKITSTLTSTEANLSNRGQILGFIDPSKILLRLHRID